MSATKKRNREGVSMLKFVEQLLQRTSGLRAVFLLSLLMAAAGAGHAAPPTITVLHAFHGADGSSPRAPLLQASDGNFYGTTYSGGDDGNGCVQGCNGTVFKITPQGQFTLLHTFVGGGNSYQDGRNPVGGLVEAPDGYLYGVTESGGAHGGNYGVFYRISKTGQFQRLHEFCPTGMIGCNEGANPQAGLTLGHDGYFYGTLTDPPSYNRVFRITSTGVYTDVKNLYGTGLGYVRNGALLQASDDNLYGVTTGGIYRVTPALGFAPVYFFGPGNGTGLSGLIQATDGNLYGATYVSPGNRGFVFRLGLDGSHQNILALGDTTTGVVPSSLLQASDGNLWGTTELGGSGGFVYATTTDGTLLYSLPLTAAATGNRALALLIQGTDGKLYGTASSYGPGSGNGAGTFFVVDAGLPSCNQVSVPDVVILSQADATTAITNARLAVGTITTASSSSVPAGRVISESPSAGTDVTSVAEVKLVVSVG